MPADDVFLSNGPDQEFADELELFGQFVGSWDVWIAPSREAREHDQSDGERGTTIRFYDREIDGWRSTWLGPRHHAVMPFIARLVDDEIVLEGSFEETV